MADFEWDEDKNQKNIKKHKVGFNQVKSVFDDEHSIEFEADGKAEYRVVRIGKTATKLILFVVYTMRGLVVRLISARQANRKERNLYIEKKLKKQDDEGIDS